MKSTLIALFALFTGQSEAANILYEEKLLPETVITPAHELVLRGYSDEEGPATLILRLDDSQSHDYATRVNEEWVVLPGLFELRLPVALFHTPNKRKLNLRDLRTATVFTAADYVKLTDVRWEVEPLLGNDVLALDFGSTGSAIHSGFELIDPSDARISGQLEAVERPYLDSLVSDGIRGIERITLPVDPGQYRLTLWTEDVGQWETPPRYIERRIKINGATILHERFSESDWLESRYFQHVDALSLPMRGRPQTFPVTVKASQKTIDIAFAGNNKTALFVSGLLLEKGKAASTAAFVERRRSDRLHALWPTVNRGPLLAKVARNGNLTPNLKEFEFTLTPEHDEIISDVALSLPDGMTGEIRFMQTSLLRPSPQTRLLVRSDQALRGDIVGRPLKTAVPAKFHVLVYGRSHGSGGLQSAQLEINGHKFEFDVGSSSEEETKPNVPYRGVYLDHAYYLANPSERRSQLWCDVAFLAKLGFTTIAPPFSLEVADFKQDYAFYRSAGFEGPIMVYAALKRWIRKYGIEEAARRVREVNQPNLIWSIADEPSNPGAGNANLASQIETLRALVPSARLAGHLNSEKDAQFASLFDVVLVNQGFWNHRDSIPDDVETWFYNIQKSDGTLPDLIHSAENVTGYLQWHARNPVGDPYDPTDGREGDKSFLLPSAEVCPDVPSFNRDLLQILN